MKNVKKLSAIILAMVIMLGSVMVTSATEALPQTNKVINCVGNWNNWSNAINTNAFEHSGIEFISADNGVVSKYYPDAYVVYRVEKNSPFIANFLIFREHTQGSPIFYVSPDGVNYTEYEMTLITDGDKFTYYTNGIGENNKYVKIVICDTATAYWHCDLRSLSYNVNTEGQVTPDTKLDFVNNFDNLVSPYQNTHLVEVTNDRTHVSGGGLSGTDTPNTYIVFKVQDNSPIKAEVKCTASARPAFYTSPDGINWTKLALNATRSTQNNQIILYYRDGIGVGNRYLKVQTSTTKLANVWESDLQTLCFNAYVETEPPLTEEETMPSDIEKSPNLDYSGKTVGVLTPNNKPTYYNDLLTTLRTEINADITEISWTDVSTALDPTKIEAIIIPDSGTVPYGTKTAVKNYLNNGGKLLSLGGVPFENTLYSYNNQLLNEYDYMKEASNAAERRTFGEFNNTLFGLSGWMRNQGDNEGSRTTDIGNFSSPTDTNALYVKLNNLQSWDMLRRDISGEGYVSVGFWAKGGSNTTEISVEIRESDNARWYASVPVTEEWKYYVLGVNDFTFWQWDSNPDRGGTGDKLNFDNSAKFFIGLSTSFSSVSQGEHEFWLDDISFLDFEKNVEDEYVLEGFSPSWKYYPITNGNSITASNAQVFVADREYVLPADSVSINSGTQGAGFASGKMTRFVPLIEIYDSKNIFSGCLAWMNINSAYSSERVSNGSITACFGTNDPAFYNADGLAAVLDTVRTMLNDSLFTEAGTTEYIYVDSETESLKMGGYIRGESMNGVTMDIDLAKEGIRIKSLSYDLETAEIVKEYADNILSTISVDYQLSEGKPDTVMITLKKDGVAVDRIVQEIDYWSPKPLSERNYITKANGEFYQNGKVLRLYGVNFLPNVAAVGFDSAGDNQGSYHEQWWDDSAYDPEKVYNQLLRVKDIGFNAVAINCYIQEAEESKNLIHFINMCDELGIYVDCFLAGADGVTTNGGAAKEIIELQHLNEFDNIVAYDIAWERTFGSYAGNYSNANGRKALDKKWIDWVVKNYGSVSNAELIWNEAMPKNVAGEYVGPTDDMLKSPNKSALVAAFRRFADEYLGTTYGEIISLLKTADPYHLYSSRAGAPSGTAMYSPANMVYDAQGLASVYDFYSPEFYDEGSGYDKRDFDFVNIYAQFAMPDSPVVWKEFGESVWQGSNFLSPETHIKYSTSLKKQANTAEAMLRSAISTHSTALYTWILQPGLRVDEKSDYGIINPDGSDRPVTKIFREYLNEFMNQPTRGEADVTFTVDRDLSASGWQQMYINIKDELLKAIDEGKTVALVDKATDTTTANVSDASIGNCGKASEVNPARYVNGEIRSVEVQGSDGVWHTVTDGKYINLPKGIVKLRVTTQNTQRAQWITSGTGAVSLVSTADSDIEFKHTITENVKYLEKTTEEFILTDNYSSGSLAITIKHSAEDRFDFGTPFNFTIIPEMNTTLDFVNNYTSSIGKAFETKDVAQGYQTGVIGNNIPESYVVYNVEDNSPVSAKFKWQATSGKPLFYVSRDGIAWTEFEMMTDKAGTYYTYGIGEGNKYIKIFISDTNLAETWRCDLRSISYNENIAQITFDNTLDFVKDYAKSVSKATTKTNGIVKNDVYGLVGNSTPNDYIVYEVEKNSPILATFVLYRDKTSARPEFYASSNGESWTKLTMKATVNGNYIYYSRDCIGAENKYVKIVISNSALTNSWYIDLRSLSYNLIDPSDDGKTNAIDMTIVRKQLLGLESGYNIDYNRDGKHNILDLVRVKRYLSE